MRTSWGDRKRRRARKGRQRRWGGAVLEFALVLPLLISLLLGMLEFGRAFMVATAMTTAAREGARAGCVVNGSNTQVLSAVSTALANQNINTAHLSTTVKVNGVVANASTASTGNSISVTVIIPYNDVSWVGLGKFLGNKNLTAYAVMRRE